MPVVSSDETEGTVSPSVLTFDAGDWNVDKTVTVTGIVSWDGRDQANCVFFFELNAGVRTVFNPFVFHNVEFIFGFWFYKCSILSLLKCRPLIASSTFD